MKKTGAFMIFFILLFSAMSLVIAEENETESGSYSTTFQQNQSKIDDGFECLEEKVEGNCDSLSVQEIALTILASPKSSVTSECVKALKEMKKSENCFGDNSCTIKDTALAVLALHHVSEDTEEIENWILKQNKTADDLTWYLQQDSNRAAECNIKYNDEDYTINVGNNKKIDSSAGSCLSLAQSNFWLRISPDCYEETFAISCDQDFISNLLYKSKNSPTVFVLSDTQSQPEFGTINLKVKAKCFSTSSSCDYEGSAWATLALLKTGNDVENFIPYIIAASDSNKRFLPNAFTYMITGYEDYGNILIQNQKLGNYWQADSSAYNKFYDTALALLALEDSSAEQVIKAKDWLLFSQPSDGCWGDSIRDTAIILWALEHRSGKVTSGGGVTYCSEANYFCVPTSDCPREEQLENYFCSGLSQICCETENLLSCSEKNGQECSSDEFCTGNSERASDTNDCCLASCEERTEPETDNICEDEMRYVCLDSCGDTQEEVDFSCGSTSLQKCCRTSEKEESSLWWIWILIILILIVLGAIIYIKRDKLKPLYYKIKSKLSRKKGSGNNQPPSGPSGPRPPGPPGMPPRPGFPPVRRPMPSRPSVRPPQKQDKSMDDTFKKLKEMSK